MRNTGTQTKSQQPDPGDDARNQVLCPIGRALDAPELLPCFSQTFFETTANDRTRTLRELLNIRANLDLAETFGILSPFDGIRLRMGTSLEEQAAQSTALEPSVKAAIDERYPADTEASIFEFLRNVITLHRLGAFSRDEAQELIDPDYFQENDENEISADLSALNDLIARVTYGASALRERSATVSVNATCNLNDDFDNGITLLDPELDYQRDTSRCGEITISFSELQAKLGPPNYEPWPGGKVTTEWVLHHRGHVFTIYDYKQSDESGEGSIPVSQIRSDKPLTWGIGAHRGVNPELLISALQ